MSALLEVRDLRVSFLTDHGIARAVDGASFTLHEGRTLGVVGESGCGKSATARAILGLIEPPGWIAGGEILFHRHGQTTDLARLAPRGRQIRRLRGREIAMIFQEPMTALNPVFTIGAQIVEALTLHERLPAAAARARAIEALAAVGIPSPEARFGEYPHQLSGGMRQRAVIAMAMVCNPALLIADEPTTALDVTIQAQVLDLMNTMRAKFGSTIVFITHDLGVIAQMADDVIVMYRGKVVEAGPVGQIFRNPLHPYTRGLLRSIPSLADDGAERLATIEGSVPSPTARLEGCAFAPRCADVMPICRRAVPALAGEGEHRSACFLHHRLEESAVARD